MDTENPKTVLFPSRLNAFKIGNQGAIITSKFTLQSAIPGEVQSFLSGIDRVLNTENFDRLFYPPVVWKDINIPIGRRVDLSMTDGSYTGELMILENIKVVRTETKQGTLFVYTLSFTKENEREDEHLAHSLNQKDAVGKEFIVSEFEMKLNATDVAHTMRGE